MFARRSVPHLASPMTYRLMIALFRTAGSAMGNFHAHFSLGLTGSTLITGTSFAGLIG